MSWVFKRIRAYSLPSYFCDQKRHNEAEGKRVISMLLDKIQSTGNSIGAKTIFVLSPSLYNFHLNACNKDIASIQFCIENKKELDFLLESLKGNSKSGGNKFVKNFSGRNYSINQFQNLFKNSNYFYIDYLRHISNKTIKVASLYNNGDPFHYSPLGNLYLAKAIISKLKT